VELVDWGGLKGAVILLTADCIQKGSSMLLACLVTIGGSCLETLLLSYISCCKRVRFCSASKRCDFRYHLRFLHHCKGCEEEDAPDSVVWRGEVDDDCSAANADVHERNDGIRELLDHDSLLSCFWLYSLSLSLCLSLTLLSVLSIRERG
jgi:hypothetical protein